jgi:Uncharacterized protein conserved in bacteria (DUF2252)
MLRGPDCHRGYLGGSNVFDQAIAQFATAYAGQNEREYESLVVAPLTMSPH